MATVTFSGTISAQATDGEIVTLTVTKPDTTTETLTTKTLADKTYTYTKEYTVAGNYSATMHMDADATYVAVDVGPISFVILLQSRTATLTINVS